MEQEVKICRVCKHEFVVDSERLEFYKKIEVPVPVDCPDCRLRHRLAFWMFGKFHKRKCDLSGESVISIFPANARFPVYKTTHWYSDSWEPPYQEYDPVRPFFDQLYELQTKSPKPHQYGTQNQNSDYSDDVWECKNCYLCRSMLRSENVYYSYRTFNGHDSLDLCYCYDSDKSYGSNYCFKLFNTKYAFDSRDAIDSAFLYDCRDVKNCFMCWNLRHKQYCILNEQYSREDYFKKIAEYNTGSWDELQKIKEEFSRRIKEEAIHKTNYNVRVYGSTGNFMTDCKSCDNSYFLESSENCFDVYRGLESKETADSNGVWQAQMCWGVMQLSRGYRLFNSLYCTDCNNSEYLDFCTNCENCFGCVGLRNKKYCILNKQYEEHEYLELKNRIVSAMKASGEYGQSFPMKMAYTGYNLSLASTIFPASKEEVEGWGGYWEELEESQPADRELAEYVDDIKDVGDNILGKGFKCISSGRPFNVVEDELRYLKSNNLPLPREYPDVRTLSRLSMLMRVERNKANCYFCSKEIISYYPSELGYKIVACEECYQAKIA